MEKFSPTPLVYYPKISNALGIKFYVKHDDQFNFVGGGSKARKISFIIKKAQTEGCNALVSAGAANSNHARVVALTAAKLGWKCTLVIHDKEDYSKGNLLLMKLAGANLLFVEMQDVREVMDQAMKEYRSNGLRPFYIYGGGHCTEGSAAYFHAAQELAEQVQQLGVTPSYIIHASGTGGTQAGLHLGVKRWLKNVKVIGISIARERERGYEAVRDSVKSLCHSTNDTLDMLNDIVFLDSWRGDGYNAIYPSLLNIIKWAAELEGLVTDPTYTGKALTALIDLVNTNEIEAGSSVIFWHTGGLINLFSHYKNFE